MTVDSQVLRMPPRALRPGGSRSSDGLWVKRGLDDARLLAERAGLNVSSRLLDWGCGPGRLLAGIHRVVGPIQTYVGVDVKADVVEWAQANLTTTWSTFLHVHQRNERYNVEGETSHLLPMGDAAVDIICAFSVFSHMRTHDVAGYGAEMARLLRPGGLVVLTAFVEPDVPEEVENPQDYLPDLPWKGPLHCVRYERAYFTKLLGTSGLEVVEFTHHVLDRDGQSLFIARPAIG